VFPDALDGLEQWRCWARDWRLFRASPSDLWGVLEPSPREIAIDYSSGLLVAWMISILWVDVWHRWGFGFDSPISSWFIKWVYRHNEGYLTGKQVNLDKNRVSSRAEDSLLCLWLIGHISSLQRWYINHSPLLYLLAHLASCLACIAFSYWCGLVFSLVLNCLGGLHSLVELVLELFRHLFYCLVKFVENLNRLFILL